MSHFEGKNLQIKMLLDTFFFKGLEMGYSIAVIYAKHWFITSVGAEAATNK